MENVANQQEYRNTYENVKRIINNSSRNIALLTTFRIIHEGGVSKLDDDSYFEILGNVIANSMTDIIDIEIHREKTRVQKLIELAHARNIKVVLSYHDFKKTPDKATIVSELTKMQSAGADFAKVAAIPQSPRDVITLMDATEEASSKLSVSLITMAMGELGKISRVAGPVIGSVLSFGQNGPASAPGQLPIQNLRQALYSVTSVENQKYLYAE